MNPGECREVGHRVVDLLAEYLEHIEEKQVFPNVERSCSRSARTRLRSLRASVNQREISSASTSNPADGDPLNTLYF